MKKKEWITKHCQNCGAAFQVRGSPSRVDRDKFCSRSCSATKRLTKHGHAKNGKQSPTYNCWASMINRCTNPSAANYPRYGGRGIAVCERWLGFDNFLADMGEKPVGRSIDRINTFGNYEPDNCRWATITEQQRNLRNNVMVTLLGRAQCMSAWAQELGMEVSTLAYRVKRGWTEHQILSTPVRYGNRIKTESSLPPVV